MPTRRRKECDLSEAPWVGVLLKERNRRGDTGATRQNMTSLSAQICISGSMAKVPASVTSEHVERVLRDPCAG